MEFAKIVQQTVLQTTMEIVFAILVMNSTLPHKLVIYFAYQTFTQLLKELAYAMKDISFKVVNAFLPSILMVVLEGQFMTQLEIAYVPNHYTWTLLQIGVQLAIPMIDKF